VTSPAGPAFAVVGECELIWVEGGDAESFLQGLLSNDVAALAPGGTCRALMLDSAGHIRADMRVARTAPDGFTLVVDDGGGGALAALLDGYLFSEDVDILGPEPAALLTLVDGEEAGGAEIVLPGRIPGTRDLVGGDPAALAAAAGAPLAPAARLEARRVEAGVPRFGVDVTTANLVQEAALETAAVSFDKGCYLGQETVARVAYRGRVNRRLVGVVLDRPAAHGATLTVEGRDVGTLTSPVDSPAFGHIGLAILRREVPIGATVAVGDAGATGRVVEVPFTHSAIPRKS
jgi:folate-binding protein YgfZ